MMKTTVKRPGYYVEGRYFGPNYAQACARAVWLAKDYRRLVDVILYYSDTEGTYRDVKLRPGAPRA